MKVAVCVSGKINSIDGETGLQRNANRLKEVFEGYPIFNGTWSSDVDKWNSSFGAAQCEVFVEPKMHYHPYLDVPKEAHTCDHFTQRIPWAQTLPKKKKTWTSHHTKQILIHALLCKAIPWKNFDVIVRTRFDGFINKNANFKPFIEDCFKTKRCHGFAVTQAKRWNDAYDSPIEGKKEFYMLDQLIIHHANRFDPDEVLRLHDAGHLHAAEWGWAQVLSVPYGGIHSNHHMFVNHDKGVLPQFLCQ